MDDDERLIKKLTFLASVERASWLTGREAMQSAARRLSELREERAKAGGARVASDEKRQSSESVANDNHNRAEAAEAREAAAYRAGMEAAAKVCDELRANRPTTERGLLIADECAAAIRAHSER